MPSALCGHTTDYQQTEEYPFQEDRQRGPLLQDGGRPASRELKESSEDKKAVMSLPLLKLVMSHSQAASAGKGESQVLRMLADRLLERENGPVRGLSW